METLLFFNLGGGEIVVVLLVVLLFFGSKKLPELAKGLGKGIRQFKEAAGDIQKDITDSALEIKKDINIKKEIEDKLKN